MHERLFLRTKLNFLLLFRPEEQLTSPQNRWQRKHARNTISAMNCSVVQHLSLHLRKVFKFSGSSCSKTGTFRHARRLKSFPRHVVPTISVSKSPQSLSINGVITENQQAIADSFQNHFLSTADKIISNINNTDDAEDKGCIDYPYRALLTLFQI
jgi:hypothetical protein